MMDDTPLLDHIGVAVESIEQTRRIYQALGLAVEGEEELVEQRVRVAFLPVGDSRLELLEPTSADSPIARHLERRGFSSAAIAAVLRETGDLDDLC